MQRLGVAYLPFRFGVVFPTGAVLFFAVNAKQPETFISIIGIRMYAFPYHLHVGLEKIDDDVLQLLGFKEAEDPAECIMRGDPVLFYIKKFLEPPGL